MSIPADIWAEPVADWLEGALPRTPDGWSDYAMSAYQFGCAALVSLSRARDMGSGAEPLANPVQPKVMPRWDDICVTVLSLLSQRREIEYRQFDGTRNTPQREPDQFEVRRIYPDGEAPEIPAPNVAAAYGCGPARVQAEGLAILETLGLVTDGAWAPAADLVFWRKQPRAWQMEPAQDPRFEEGLARCLETMPEDVAQTLHDLVEITPDNITASVARQEAANEKLAARFPRKAQAKFDRKVTRERQFRLLLSHAQTQMDDLFFEAWRLPEGWLGAAAQESALHIFSDPLAQAMRGEALNAMNLAFPQEMPQ